MNNSTGTALVEVYDLDVVTAEATLRLDPAGVVNSTTDAAAAATKGAVKATTKTLRKTVTSGGTN